MTESTSHASRRLGILGAGNVGQPIGRHWVAAGHTVTFGSRSPEHLSPFVASLDGGARAATLAEAAQVSDVVLLSVPHPALEELLDTIGDRLAGKIVIDATNPVVLTEDGRVVSTLGGGLTQGRHTAKLLPDATVVRAFTHVMDELLWSRGTRQRHFWGMALAGDDAGAKDVVAQLVHDAGFVPVDLGGLDDSAALDPGGAVFPHMFTPADLRVAAGFTG
ncbi:NADPH-dependent F420 reductase [Streptomyces sp. 351MFTsu5.1]|uniref:NADPH-dependent F420 reductase n=1 Tax=Streptomyces sp. 351MFTsu5.1 TaxID=1172180 RepID=UPI0003714690|nr:NAD(P)-binding domain-containing protein [Streptomyces sp. 351MFTsu5.1]